MVCIIYYEMAIFIEALNATFNLAVVQNSSQFKPNVVDRIEPSTINVKR